MSYNSVKSTSFLNVEAKHKSGFSAKQGWSDYYESDREWLMSDQEEELIRLLSVEHIPDNRHLTSDILIESV